MDKTVHRSSELAEPEPPAPSGPGTRAAESGAVRRVESASLFQRGREVVIVHHGQEYRLRITKSDKLILTK
jgi:hemin uptake protein HemP